jgi:hypothetical protein
MFWKKKLQELSFMLVSCLAYSSTRKMEAICGWLSPDYMALSQKTELFIATAARTSNKTEAFVFT